MKLQLAVISLFALLSMTAYAQEAVYLCVSSDGTREYTNTGDTKGCKKVDMDGITVVPAPKRVTQAATAPAATAATAATAKPAAMPAAFPRVDSNRQQLMDQERRQILQNEMKAEERKLLLLRQEYNNGAAAKQAGEQNDGQYQQRVTLLKEDINRAEKNIEALKRELGNLR